jgi:hypothetical protein
VVQVSLLLLAAFLGKLAVTSLQQRGEGDHHVGMGQAILLAVLALLAVGGAGWMGLRTVRGPEPPSLEG